LLDSDLFDKNSTYQKNIRAAFLLFFSSLLSTYGEYFLDDDTFDRISFANEQSLAKKVTQ
jgi:hypothetical protein